MLLVTGGTNGIGREIVKKFILEGKKIILICRNPDKAIDLKVHKIIKADFSDINQVKMISSQIEEAVDVLINNAAMAESKKVINVDGNDINKTLIVNLFSPYILTQMLINEKKIKPDGKIINVSSTVHWSGVPITKRNLIVSKVGHYQNSKFGILVLGDYWVKTGIKVVTVNPGYVDTGIWHSRGPGEYIHKYLRKVFALKPSESVSIFMKALEPQYGNNEYIGPYRDSVLTELTKKTNWGVIMSLNDFLGKSMLYGEPKEISRSDLSKDLNSLLEILSTCKAFFI